MRTITKLVVHCSATMPDIDIGRDEIDVWHRNRVPPFSEIGYHFVIRRDGTLETGRDLEKVGAHVKGFNWSSIGICLVGGVDTCNDPEDNFTIEQNTTLEVLLIALTATFPDAEVLGHRDLSPDLDGDGEIEPDEWMKACPSFDVGMWWDDLSAE